ncbi:DNA-binding protein, partial [Clostridioides difficile]|nr:DNA-binding protein [Clostridioides difficile]MCJ0436466.1 DNA-binding protein [Clostridioides difficile]
VSKLGYMWLIPKDAEKPIDGRTKQGKELYHE